MNKYFLLVLVFIISIFSFSTKAFADIQIKAFAPEGIIQTSTTDFYWYADYRANNSFGVTIYDKNGTATSLGYTLSGFGANITPSDAMVNHNTVNIDDYFIIFTLCSGNSYCDNYTTYTVIRKSTATKIASGWLGGSGGGNPSYAVAGDFLIFSTSSGIKTLQLSTGTWTNGNGSTYTNMNGLVGVNQIRGASDGQGTYYLSNYDDVGLTHYTIKYISWGVVDSSTFGINEEFVAFDGLNIIEDYRIFGPYTNGLFLSIGTNGPYNFSLDPVLLTNVDYNVFSYTKEDWNDPFWQWYNIIPGESSVEESALFNLFVANSQFYYVKDAPYLDFNYTTGPFVGYELDVAGDIESVYYVDAGYLYKKTDTVGYIGDIATDGVDTGSSQTGTGTTGTGTIDYDISVFDFDLNGDGEVGLLNGEIFIGIGNVIVYFFQKLMDFFTNIKLLIEKLGEGFTDEVKLLETFNFNFDLIPSANATESLSSIVNNNVDEVAYKETTLGKIDVLIKGFIAFFILTVGIAFFIFVNRNKG